MNETKQTKDPLAPTVTFDYIKSNAFRCIHADGAIGGITPNGHIHMALFSERSAIPRRMVQELRGDKTLGDVRETETRNSIVREMDVDVFLTIEAAKSLHDWLTQQLEEYESIIKRGNK